MAITSNSRTNHTVDLEERNSRDRHQESARNTQFASRRMYNIWELPPWPGPESRLVSCKKKKTSPMFHAQIRTFWITQKRTQHVHTCTHTHAHTFIHTQTQTHTRTHMHIHTHAHTHTHAHCDTHTRRMVRRREMSQMCKRLFNILTHFISCTMVRISVWSIVTDEWQNCHTFKCDWYKPVSVSVFEGNRSDFFVI